MKNHCLMNLIALPWDELRCLSEQYQGIVFLDLGEESVPHFILDLVLELERENVVINSSPCEIFERSCLVNKTHGHQKDLVFLLKSIETGVLERITHWVSCQAPHSVILLSEYMSEC